MAGLQDQRQADEGQQAELGQLCGAEGVAAMAGMTLKVHARCLQRGAYRKCFAWEVYLPKITEHAGKAGSQSASDIKGCLPASTSYSCQVFQLAP